MRNYLIYCMLLLICSGNELHSQGVDSTFYKQFPYRVGNLGFKSDSLELIIPDIPHGIVSKYALQVHNFGINPMIIQDGRSSRFVSVKANPPLLSPSTTGVLEVSIDIVNELPLGPFRAELSLETDDNVAKYKFLYLLTNVIENQNGSGAQQNYDTIPRLVFEHYNYDFGYLNRGKKIYHSFVYTNLGGIPIVVERVDVSPGCKLVFPVPEIINPGESGIIRMRISTRGCIGVQHRSVVLYTNDPLTPMITLGAHGIVKAESPSAKSPNFCNEKPGSF